MNVAIATSTMRPAARGTIFYDGECRLCTGGAMRFGPMLRRRGFELLPLQSPGAGDALHVGREELLDEVRLLARDGRVVGGADAIIEVARHVWWATPLWLLAFIPGMRPILRRLYRWLVPYRYCVVGRCGQPSPLARIVVRILQWAPAIALPATAVTLRSHLPPWVFMWLMAAAIFYGCKWMTWRDAPPALRARRMLSLGYLLGWPGMNAREFLARHALQPPASDGGWVRASMRLLVGAVLVWGAARLLFPENPLIAGWIGMIGLILILHFGLFHLMALVWQSAGVNARPIMDRAIVSTSVGEFWGRRWNRGFSDLVRRYAFRPLMPTLGGAGALLATFAISGLLHELVITLPAGAGWGGPTAYFVIQGIAVLLERSRFGRRIGLSRGWRGWSFMAITTVAPVGLLFPPAFVEHVILPFMQAIGAFSPPPQVELSGTLLIRFGGLLHFGILIASALVPQVLDWRRELAKLQPLMRHLVWVHGVFIVLVIIGFGVISMICAAEMASGSMLARSICGFIAIFWLIRLGLQFFLFDARPYLTSVLLKLGYHGLTVTFALLVLAYSWCAIAA